MSSLLCPMVLESCQTGLRGRRLSSIDSLTVIPPHFSDGSSALEDGALFDETDRHEMIITSVESPTELIVPILSPVSDAHMSDYASKITIPRHHHHNTQHTLAACDASLPTSTSPHTTLVNRKPSFMNCVENKSEQVKLERIRWRLASGFFAYFLCGWGDGGKLLKIPQVMLSFTSRFSHWDCHPL